MLLYCYQALFVASVTVSYRLHLRHGSLRWGTSTCNTENVYSTINSTVETTPVVFSIMDNGEYTASSCPHIRRAFQSSGRYSTRHCSSPDAFFDCSRRTPLRQLRRFSLFILHENEPKTQTVTFKRGFMALSRFRRRFVIIVVAAAALMMSI